LFQIMKLFHYDTEIGEELTTTLEVEATNVMTDVTMEADTRGI